MFYVLDYYPSGWRHRIHSPNTGKLVETWDAFLELQREGVVKSIGVSRLAIAGVVASAANVGFCEGKSGFQPCFPWNMMVWTMFSKEHDGFHHVFQGELGFN